MNSIALIEVAQSDERCDGCTRREVISCDAGVNVATLPDGDKTQFTVITENTGF